MADVAIAVPVGVPTPVIPSNMAINPYMDWAPLPGIPLWLIVAFGFVFLVVIVFLYWIFRIGKMRGVKGYVQTAKNQMQDEVQVWVLSKTQKMTIECLKIIDAVIHYRDKQIITRWMHISPFSTIRVGGVPGVLVSSDFDQTRDIISEIALSYACDQFNFNQEELKKQVKRQRELTEEQRLDSSNEGQQIVNVKQMPNIQPITNYSDYERYGCRCLQAIHPDGLEIPSYNIFDPVKFRKYFPHGCSATLFGGEFLRDSRKLNMTRKTPGLLEKYLPIGIVAGISLVAIMAAWMVPL